MIFFLSCYPSQFTVNTGGFPATAGGDSDKSLLVPPQCFRNWWLNNRNNLSSLILERAIREDLPHLTSLGLCWFMPDGKQVVLHHVKSLGWSDNIKVKGFAAEPRKVMGWMLVCLFCSDLLWSFTALTIWNCLFALLHQFLFSLLL